MSWAPARRELKLEGNLGVLSELFETSTESWGQDITTPIPAYRISSRACTKVNIKTFHGHCTFNLGLHVPTWYWLFFLFSSVTVIGFCHNSSLRFMVFNRGKLPLSENATNLEDTTNYLGGANKGDDNHKIYYFCLDLSLVLETYSRVFDASITVAHTSWLWLFIWNCVNRSLAGDWIKLDMNVDHLGGANRGNGNFNFLYAYLDSSWFYTWYWFSYFFSSVAVIGLRHIS